MFGPYWEGHKATVSFKGGVGRVRGVSGRVTKQALALEGGIFMFGSTRGGQLHFWGFGHFRGVTATSDDFRRKIALARGVTKLRPALSKVLFMFGG